MKKIEIKIERTNKLLDKISDNLDNLIVETFDSASPVIAKNMKALQKAKNEIIDEFGLEEFLKYGSDLLNRAKLIGRKFDNIIGIFTHEEEKLEKELLSYMSKKKIANYLRY
ncbi:MAG: hypothetical protein NTX65_11500 [Ignavibacteriales bacterium]|nr:hypothetical protein [Ignavibacteriales bacterium]